MIGKGYSRTPEYFLLYHVVTRHPSKPSNIDELTALVEYDKETVTHFVRLADVLRKRLKANLMDKVGGIFDVAIMGFTQFSRYLTTGDRTAKFE
jgi:hypothetical protein